MGDPRGGVKPAAGPGRGPRSASRSAKIDQPEASPTAATAARRPIDSLAEPVICSRFWRNRKGEAVVVQLRQFEGRAIADTRVYFTGKDGTLQPSKKGLAIVVARLPDLAAALNKALARAVDLGLLGTPAPEGRGDA
jgi:hypothetical protein